MTWLPLESKMFFSIAYNADTRTLYLRFRSGDVNRYFHFSEDDYQQFLRAESKGRHFLSNIRNCFPYERLAKLRSLDQVNTALTVRLQISGAPVFWCIMKRG